MSEAPKVAICIPYYRQVEGPTLLSCMDLSARSAASVAMLPIKCSGCYIEDNRNGAVRYALDTGIPFDWLLWIDGDMTFPGDALLRLLAHDKDIVGANYRARTPPHGFTGHYLDGRDTHLMEPGLHRMGHMPTGLLLTRFSIYQKLPYPWFKPGLNGEPRDDVYFCNYARSRGFEVWCDHDLTREVCHIADQIIPWFQPEQLIAPGAQLDTEKSAVAARERARRSRESYEQSGHDSARIPA